MWPKLLALVLPLGLDTFALAAALGIAGIDRRERLRVSALFTAFEVGMPLIGFFGGALAGRVVGNAADVIAIVLLIGLGVYMLWPGRDSNGDGRLRLLGRTRGVAAIGLGISISLDELAIGFTLGLFGFPVVLVVGLIGVQTFVVTQAGLQLGARIGEGVREGAERLAGVALVGLGLVLAVERVVSGG